MTTRVGITQTVYYITPTMNNANLRLSSYVISGFVNN